MYQTFINTIWEYYRLSKRDFPWRTTNNPYDILISEMMLQQTQTSRVLPKYVSFLKKFPDINSLSKASLSEILTEWHGLGYNRRALYLKKSAEKITAEFSGNIPLEHATLTQLPGIGFATASAIIVFAKNKPLVFVETNIRRVFIHFFFRNKKDINDKQILPFINKTMDLKNPREWYYALMDYGNMLGKNLKENPNKRSKHYSPQSSFHGSLRQLRGAILSELLAHPTMKIEELKMKLGFDTERFDKALQEMLKEGFITVTEGLIEFNNSE